MSFLTFDHDRSESLEKNHPLLRMDIISNALNTVQNVVELEIASRQAKKEERYGKVQKVSKQLFDTEWTNYRAQKAAYSIINPILPIEQPIFIAPAVHKETILDGNISIDQNQFDAMTADKNIEVIQQSATLLNAPDFVEAELQQIVDSEVKSEVNKIIEESRRIASAIATPISEAINAIYQESI